MEEEEKEATRQRVSVGNKWWHDGRPRSPTVSWATTSRKKKTRDAYIVGTADDGQLQRAIAAGTGPAVPIAYPRRELNEFGNVCDNTAVEFSQFGQFTAQSCDSRRAIVRSALRASPLNHHTV